MVTKKVSEKPGQDFYFSQLAARKMKPTLMLQALLSLGVKPIPFSQIFANVVPKKYLFNSL